MAGSKDTKRVIRVFIASPGGLEVERRAFKDTIDDLNKGFGDGAGVEFIPLGWEDTLSPAGQRVQSEINKDVKACHLFLLVLDELWGRRNKEAVWHPVACLPGLEKLRPSNTMEEFSLAMSLWEQRQRPEVHVVLKKLPANAARDPGVERKCVLKLRKLLARSGKVLFKEWEDTDRFKILVDAILRRHVRSDDQDSGGEIDLTPRPPDFGPKFKQRLTELEADLKLAREERHRAQRELRELQRALPASKRRKRAGGRSNADKQRERSSAGAEHSRAEALALALAELASKAALEGNLEQARQDFAKAMEGTTNLSVLYLGYEFFNRIGELDEAERLLRRWLAISGPEAQTADTAAAYGNLGLIHRTRGDLDQAERMLRRALEIDEKLGHFEGMANDYGNLGPIYATLGDLDRGERMLRKALEIDEKLGRLEGMADEYGNLGAIHRMRGDLDEAERMHRKALEIHKNLGLLEGMASDYGNLGMIQSARGDLDEAERMHRTALEIDEKLGRLEGMANQYGNLSVIHQTRGDLDEAELMLRKSLEIDKHLGRLEGMARTYANLGVIHRKRGNLDDAERMLRKALEIDEKVGRPEGVAACYGNLGLIHRERGELDEAERMLRKSLEINEKLSRLEGMATQYANLGTVQAERGDIPAARELWNTARKLYEKIGMPQMVAKVQSGIDALADAPTSQTDAEG